jgi:hypothetical protein
VGYFLQEHDIYVGSLFDELNVRFAPGQRHAKAPEMKRTHFGGIDEMVALQKEFKIFKKGRSFMMSVRLLNVGAFNNDAKNRWHDYLASMAERPSNKAGKNGDAAIVDALVKNLASKSPLPVHFSSHDMREDERVLIADKAKPLHYMNADYLSVSLPMKPYDPTRESAAKPAKKKKKR